MKDDYSDLMICRYEKHVMISLFWGMFRHLYALLSCLVFLDLPRYDFIQKLLRSYNSIVWIILYSHVIATLLLSCLFASYRINLLQHRDICATIKLKRIASLNAVFFRLIRPPFTVFVFISCYYLKRLLNFMANKETQCNNEISTTIINAFYLR